MSRKKFLPTPTGDALSLFLLEGHQKHIERFENLGIADLLHPDSRQGRIFGLRTDERRRICAAIGAKAASIETFRGKSWPIEWTKFGDKEVEAWFLTNFAWFYSSVNDPESTIEGRIHMAVALGRLIEWWRWRVEGLDRMAAAKKRSEAAQPKATAARKLKALTDPPEWWDTAIESAREIRAKNGKHTAWKVAGDLAPVLRCSQKQVYRVIRSLWL